MALLVIMNCSNRCPIFYTISIKEVNLCHFPLMDDVIHDSVKTPMCGITLYNEYCDIMTPYIYLFTSNQEFGYTYSHFSVFLHVEYKNRGI